MSAILLSSSTSDDRGSRTVLASILARRFAEQPCACGMRNTVTSWQLTTISCHVTYSGVFSSLLFFSLVFSIGSNPQLLGLSISSLCRAVTQPCRREGDYRVPLFGGVDPLMFGT